MLMLLGLPSFNSFMHWPACRVYCIVSFRMNSIVTFLGNWRLDQSFVPVDFLFYIFGERSEEGAMAHPNPLAESATVGRRRISGTEQSDCTAWLVPERRSRFDVWPSLHSNRQRVIGARRVPNSTMHPLWQQESCATAGRTARCRCKFRYRTLQ